MSTIKSELRLIPAATDSPLVSVVIPSMDGSRGGNLALLLEDLRAQTVVDFEVLIPIGYSPNGHARNVAVEKAAGKFIVAIDDDVRLGHNRVLEQLVLPFSHRDDIGMTGPAQLLPEDAGSFQKRAAREISRSTSPVVKELTDSDCVCHMCLCIPTELYKAVGWESDVLISGTDPDLRRRVRLAGKRVVVVPDCWAHHPAPSSWRQLVRQAWRGGSGSGWVQRHFPGLNIPCADTHDSNVPRARPLPLRILAAGFRFLSRIVRGHLVGIVWELVYGVGFLYGFVFGSRPTTRKLWRLPEDTLEAMLRDVVFS